LIGGEGVGKFGKLGGGWGFFLPVHGTTLAATPMVGCHTHGVGADLRVCPFCRDVRLPQFATICTVCGVTLCRANIVAQGQTRRSAPTYYIRGYDDRPSGWPHLGRCRQRPCDRPVMLQNPLWGWSPTTVLCC